MCSVISIYLVYYYILVLKHYRTSTLCTLQFEVTVQNTMASFFFCLIVQDILHLYFHFVLKL